MLRADIPITRFTKSLLVRFEPAKASSKLMGFTQCYLVWEVNYTGEPLPTDIDSIDPAKYVVIPFGFESDGVTVPRIFWWLYPPWGHPVTRAAILHDYLLKQYKTFGPHPAYTKRSQIDKAFREAAYACGVGTISRWVMWSATRLMSYIRADPE